MEEKIEIIEEFPSNSNKEKTKEEEKVVKAVAEGKVVKRRGFLNARREIFSGENMSNVMSYVLTGIMMPAIKNMIYDAATKGLERAMWQEDAPRNPVERNSGGIINYSAISTKNYSPTRGSRAMITSGNQDADLFVFGTRAEADEVLMNLDAIINRYGHTTVADYYELAGKTGSYTDNKWGWVSLNGSRIDRARGGGYIITLPKATPI